MTAIPKTRRRIFFYISALAFFAIAPFLILYSLGYSFDIEHRTVEETGGIFVKTNLTGFTVSLNNGAIQKSSLLTRGLLLGNLPPGQYRLRVEKNGYQPWEKIVSVSRFNVREIRDVILIPNPLASEVVATWNVDEHLKKTFISPKARSAAFELKNNRTGRRTLLFFDTSENKIMARFALPYAAQEVIWNDAETAALLVAGDQTRTYERIVVSGAPADKTALFEKVVTISGAAKPLRIMQQDIKKVRPGNKINDFFILTHAGSLLSWNTATTGAVLLADSVEEFDALEDNVFFVAKNGFAALQILRSDTTINFGRKGYALGETPIKVVRSKHGDLFFKDGAGGLFFSSREGTGEFALLETGVHDIALDDAEKKLFFLKQNAIGVFHLRDNTYQPFEKRGNTEMVFQSNDTAFLDAAWYAKDNAHIILNTASGVFLLDTDIRGGPRIAELDAKPAETMFWSRDEKKLYLIRDTGIETIAIE